MRTVRPIRGIGVGLRPEFAEELPATTRRVDWVELHLENWQRMGGHHQSVLERVTERWPVVPHGLSLSIGGPDPLDTDWIAVNDRFCREFGAPFWTDHLCYTRVGGVYAQELLPLPFSEEAVGHTVARIRQVQKHTDVPLALENVAFYAHMPGSTLDEASFVRAVIERSACGLLLDVNNIYVNCLNHGGDPYRFLAQMPFDQVCQLHVGGHRSYGGLVVDTHKGPIIPEVWALYRQALTSAGRMIPTLVEWDELIPSLDAVLDELDLAREHAVAALGNGAA